MVDKVKILAGRKHVEAYRTAHTALYKHGWHRSIPEEHTPLLDAMRKALRGLGFNSLAEFFDTSELLNIQKLGFKDRDDFWARATKEDREKLREMWH